MDFSRNRKEQYRKRVKKLGLTPLKRFSVLLNKCKAKVCFSYGNPQIPQSVQWDDITDPLSFMGKERALRKRLQLENILGAVTKAMCGREDLHIVDFCSSSGHFGFLAASQYPKAKITLVELNNIAVESAYDRLAQSALENVQIAHCNITEFSQPFDIAVGLHACGRLTDWVLKLALENRAGFVLCPCCLGKIVGKDHHTALPNTLTYPQSTLMRQVLSSEEFYEIAGYGDFGDLSDVSVQANERRECKSVVEWDRLEYARENGYETVLCKMSPLNCSVKNDILIGIPLELLQDDVHKHGTVI